MTKTEWIQEVETIVELDPGTLKGDERLDSIGWESMHALEYIVAAESKLQKVIDGAAVASANSLTDLINLVADCLE